MKPTSKNSNKEGKKKINLQPEKFYGNSESILKKYNYLQITDSTNIPEPTEVIRISGELICTEGNITTISGASKSGKSAFTGVLIAGAISKGDYDNLPGVEITPADGKAIIHFDTEQAPHKHKGNLNSILKRTHLKSFPANLLSYNIRIEDFENYCKITEEIVGAAFEEFKGVHLIVIDGGADYIRDVNEPNPSNTLVKFFEKLANNYRAAVIVIVHLNPGGDKERGHFGSQLQRKSESVLSIKIQGEISYLEPKLLRNAGKEYIPPIYFKFDKSKGYHVFCDNKPEEKQGRLKDVKRLDEIKETANVVFAPPVSLNYTEAIEKIMNQTKKQERTAKTTFKEMKSHQIIIQGDDNNWRLNKNLE